MAEDVPRGRGNSRTVLTKLGYSAVGMRAGHDEATQDTRGYLRLRRIGQTGVLCGVLQEADWVNDMRDVRDLANKQSI